MLETERLRIVPFAEEHLTERYVSWLNDPIVVRFSRLRFRTHTLDSCRTYLESFRGTDNEFWAILVRDSGLGHIGNLTVTWDVRNGVADIAILIGEKRAWGRGFARETWLALVDSLFERGVRKVTAGTLATNTRMLKLMHRVGMAPDGTRCRQEVFEGQEVDVIFAAFFRDEWHGQQSAARRSRRAGPAQTPDRPDAGAPTERVSVPATVDSRVAHVCSFAD